MKTVTMPSTTHIFTAPMCNDLPVTVVPYEPDDKDPQKRVDIHYSYWIPDAQERAMIAAGRPVRVGIYSAQPPIIVEVSPENEGAPVVPTETEST
jgi:hypothetical protein